MSNTQATAITPSGVIVGRYNNADGVLLGFLLAEVGFTSIDYPTCNATGSRNACHCRLHSTVG